ncbi:MAG: hypothetical protein NT080_02690 [Spirochaetes bacterium]|nr:hypothetical protein [Spirochaetota bacterium]
MAVKRDFGLHLERMNAKTRGRLIAYINLKLAGLGLPVYSREGVAFLDLAREMIEHYREKDKLLQNYLPPADRRIQDFLDSWLGDLGLASVPRIPTGTLTLDSYGMARELSIPPEAAMYSSPTLTSYRVRNGVLHNPANDRRTTVGVFHVASGGLPVPPDKKAVPKLAFAKLLECALAPPDDMMVLPFTAEEHPPARAFLSLLLRPIVCPEVPGFTKERSMEIRFFAPGSLAANLDFAESIFGNSGDPFIPDNDAALDPLHWTGTTGCIILATHLVSCLKKDLGLPRWEDATERQRADGMAWKSPDEKYNEGKPFKICARDDRGVIVTIIADNYFGYSKKEIKAHISYSSNIMGLTEEEHSGGALVFPSYNLGNRFVPDTNLRSSGQTFADVVALLGERVEVHPEGYAIDRTFPNIFYLPEDAVMTIDDQAATWTNDGLPRSLRILPDNIYIHPTGYNVRMSRHGGSGAWRLVGTQAEGTLCHKPCTVSGGGKSEISKSIFDAITYQPIITGDFQADMALVKSIIDHPYGERFSDGKENHGKASRSILSQKRSLGSVIKLLSPSPLNRPEFNTWLESIPDRVKALVFLVKRFYRHDWGDDWASRFSVDVVNGTTGNVVKFDGKPVQGSFLRVGFMEGGMRWTFKLRQDFVPARKIQWEDDITASVVAPAKAVDGLSIDSSQAAYKFAKNAEARFFQRPDEAVHPGYDRQAESDMARMDNFISNFEPITRAQGVDLVERTVELSEYTRPMRDFICEAARDTRYDYFAVSSKPRIVNGAPSKNPRYLQLDPNYVDQEPRYLADIGTRLFRRIPADRPVRHPVAAVLPGRRNNPADPAAHIRPLAVYGPIHYQELPELFMDFICSLTGKSPSTTGAGSEGALTKGPFNSLVATTDLNNALLGYILTGYGAFSTAAGYIGHKWKVEHDISLLVPELWSRLAPAERDPAFLIRSGYLEKIDDFTYEGRLIPASRLGYRITPLFAANFLGRIFDTPYKVFPEEMLRPELQSLPFYVDGIENIAEAQARVAQDYLDDGSVEAAIPPLRALLHVMARGSWEGKTVHDPELRKLFSRDSVVASDWYRERLERYRDRERTYVERTRAYIARFLRAHEKDDSPSVNKTRRRLEDIGARLEELASPAFLSKLEGSIGLDPLFRG